MVDAPEEEWLVRLRHKSELRARAGLRRRGLRHPERKRAAESYGLPRLYFFRIGVSRRIISGDCVLEPCTAELPLSHAIPQLVSPAAFAFASAFRTTSTPMAMSLILPIVLVTFPSLYSWSL